MLCAAILCHRCFLINPGSCKQSPGCTVAAPTTQEAELPLAASAVMHTVPGSLVLSPNSSTASVAEPIPSARRLLRDLTGIMLGRGRTPPTWQRPAWSFPMHSSAVGGSAAVAQARSTGGVARAHSTSVGSGNSTTLAMSNATATGNGTAISTSIADATSLLGSNSSALVVANSSAVATGVASWLVGHSNFTSNHT